MSSEKKSIGEIRKEFENVQKEAQTEKQQKALDVLCLKYAQDGRKGVQVLIERCHKQKEKLQKERERLDVMRQFDAVMREKDEREEARYRRLDTVLREIQQANAEVAATKTKKGIFKKHR